MEAIPRGLVSRDMIKMIPGIKCLRTNILPSHHSGNHQFTSTASNKVTFQIPSFPNSYINTKRSFIRFVLKTSANGVLVPQANPFRRLLLKSSRGQVLENIDNYDVLCRLFQNMKTKQTLEAEAVSTKDIRAVDVGKNFSKMTNASGQPSSSSILNRISIIRSALICFRKATFVMVAVRIRRRLCVNASRTMEGIGHRLGLFSHRFDTRT